MKNLFYIIVLLLLVNINSAISQQNNDSCHYKQFFYEHYANKRKIEIVSDSIHFNKYLIFRLNLQKINEAEIPVELFFINDLYEIEDLKKAYYYMAFNKIFYGDISGFEDSDYEKITNIGDVNSLPSTKDYFDRLNLILNTTSIFRNSIPYSYTNNSKYIYYIFKTEIDGILIQNDIKKKYVNSKYKNTIKVFIPFSRYLPLYKIDTSETSGAKLYKREQISFCTNK